MAICPHVLALRLQCNTVFLRPAILKGNNGELFSPVQLIADTISYPSIATYRYTLVVSCEIIIAVTVKI
jgi:hypothetical protein